VSFEEMLEMAASGAKVLQLRSVEYARTHGVRIHCRSSFEDGPGTFVIGEDETMEHPLITAVTHSTEEARITLVGVPDRPGAAGMIFTGLAEANVNVDTIVQNDPRSEGADAEVTFTLAIEDLRIAQNALAPVVADLGINRVDADPEVGKVSIIGAGMRSHPGVAAKVFEVMGEEDINIEIIHTSPIKITCLIRAESVPHAVRALHSAFDLSATDIQEEGGLGAEAR
jgi:aspartate kinase